LIANADHVPQLQRRKETMSLFTSFLKGESIQNLDGIIPMTREQMQKLSVVVKSVFLFLNQTELS
jgi:hypothetical protein